MTLWKVDKRYTKNDEIRYYVMPYNLKGAIHCQLRFYGLKSLIKFLKLCRLTENSAEKLASKMNLKSDF